MHPIVDGEMEDSLGTAQSSPACCRNLLGGLLWAGTWLSLIASLPSFGTAGKIARAKTRSAPVRSRGAIFPFWEGELSEFAGFLKESSLEEATTVDDAIQRWCVHAWMLWVFG